MSVLNRELLFGGLVAIVGVAVAGVGGYALAHPVGPATHVAEAGPVSSPSATSAAASLTVSGPPVGTSAASPAATAPAATTSPDMPSTARAPLTVLNNTRIAGLAGRAATRFRSAGWVVNSVGNLRDDILSSCAYYDPDQSGAQEAATALREQFPGLRRVAPKFRGLPDGPVVVVLTPDWS